MAKELKKPAVAVVGAGMSGLACAYELQKQGLHPQVFESLSSVGGRSGTRRAQHYPFDLGAQFLNSGYRVTREYVNELGLSQKWKTMHPSTHHLFVDGELHCISFESNRELFSLPIYSPLSRIRLLLTYLRLRQRSRGLDLYDLSSIDPALDKESAAEFTRKWGGDVVLDRGVDAMVHTYHFHSAEELSLSCLLAACSVLDDQMRYEYLEGGIDSLAQAFADQVSVERSAPVLKVMTKQGKVYAEVDGEIHPFDRLVYATPPSVVRATYHTPTQGQDELLQGVRYASTINASFWVPQQHIWRIAMVAVPQSESASICCYFNQHSKYAEYSPEGRTLVNVFLRDSFTNQLLDKPDEEIWKLMQAEFIRLCPPLLEHSQEVVPHELQRWREAIPKYYPGYLQKVRHFSEAHQGEQNVFFCGDYMNAPWVEGSLRCGRAVAQSVLESLD